MGGVRGETVPPDRWRFDRRPVDSQKKARKRYRESVAEAAVEHLLDPHHPADVAMIS